MRGPSAERALGAEMETAALAVRVRRLALAGTVVSLALTSPACGKNPRVSPPSAPPASSADAGSVEEGVASWYGHPYHGRRTANGEIYDMNTHTAAHRTLPFDTWVKVINLENGKSSVVRINDRGPFVEGRIIDLSRKAAEDLQMVGPGTAPVRVLILDPSKVPGEELYTVQVGAFRHSDNARRVEKTLRKKYADVFIERAGDLHRVRVGRVKTMAEADTLAQRLKREHDAEHAVVVRLD